MSIAISYIITPIIGGLIGYITNDIAIRMLFLPHKAKYIGKCHIPLTPGLIPKEKSRIAEAIGDVISKNLMNEDVLTDYLLSDEMITKVTVGVQDLFDKQKQNPETLKQLLCHFLSEEELETIVDKANKNLSKQIHNQLSDTALAEKVAHLAVESVINNLKNSDLSDLSDSIGGSIRGIGRTIINPLIGTIFSKLQEPVERLLKKSIHDMLVDNSEEMLFNLLGAQVDDILRKPVMELLEGKDELITKTITIIRSIYITAIKEHLPRILHSIDISKIVRDRINEMDVAEAETLIMLVMKKELKAIVWLGAALGFIMGFVNLIINLL